MGVDRMCPFLSGFDAGLRISSQFLLEGLATVVVAGIAYFTMHDVCILLSFHLLPTFRFVTFWMVRSTLQPPDSFRLRNATSS